MVESRFNCVNQVFSDPARSPLFTGEIIYPLQGYNKKQRRKLKLKCTRQQDALRRMCVKIPFVPILTIFNIMTASVWHCSLIKSQWFQTSNSSIFQKFKEYLYSDGHKPNTVGCSKLQYTIFRSFNDYCTNISSGHWSFYSEDVDYISNQVNKN